jgi:hypothetical protein
VTDSSDPLRRLAQERGRILGEIGVRPDDARWQRIDGEAIASLLAPDLGLRLPAFAARLWRGLGRAVRGG